MMDALTPDGEGDQVEDRAPSRARARPARSGPEQSEGSAAEALSKTLPLSLSALQLANLWLDRERQALALSRCTGFAAAPILKGEGGKAFYPDRADFTDAALFQLLKTTMLAALKEQARQLFGVLTSSFHVPSAALTRWRDETLGADEKPAVDVSERSAA